MVLLKFVGPSTFLWQICEEEWKKLNKPTGNPIWNNPQQYKRSIRMIFRRTGPDRRWGSESEVTGSPGRAHTILCTPGGPLYPWLPWPSEDAAVETEEGASRSGDSLLSRATTPTRLLSARTDRMGACSKINCEKAKFERISSPISARTQITQDFLGIYERRCRWGRHSPATSVGGKCWLVRNGKGYWRLASFLWCGPA